MTSRSCFTYHANDLVKLVLVNFVGTSDFRLRGSLIHSTWRIETSLLSPWSGVSQKIDLQCVHTCDGSTGGSLKSTGSSEKMHCEVKRNSGTKNERM